MLPCNTEKETSHDLSDASISSVWQMCDMMDGLFSGAGVGGSDLPQLQCLLSLLAFLVYLFLPADMQKKKLMSSSAHVCIICDIMWSDYFHTPLHHCLHLVLLALLQPEDKAVKNKCWITHSKRRWIHVGTVAMNSYLRCSRKSNTEKQKKKY